MSYNTISECAVDTALQHRVTACVAGEERANPESVMYQVIWSVASAADIEAAYASALAAGNPNPGGDETVITDGMILAATQAALPALPTNP